MTMDPGINAETGDHGSLLVSVTWLLVSISGLFLCLRLYCKFKRKRHLWWDDYVLIWAWLCLLIDCCCLTYTVSLGFGKHFLAINPAVLPSMGLMGMVAGGFAIFAAMYSKTSFAITLLRISERKTRILLWFVIISVHIALGGSALIPLIQCKPIEKNWNLMAPGKCWNPKIFSNYAIAAAAYSGAMDIVLALIPWKMIWNLQMKEKIGVATAMSMGVFAGVSAIAKSVDIPELANEDFSYSGVSLILWGQVESAICIIAVSIPVLRVLLIEFFDLQRVTDETSGQRGLQTFPTETTSGIGRPPSFVFPKEGETPPTSTSQMEMLNWRTGSSEMLL